MIEEALVEVDVGVVVVEVGRCVMVVRSGCGYCWPPGLVTRGDDATTGFRALWSTIGCVGSGGVECVWCAGQPPLFRRGDEATTPSETVAARWCNKDGVIKDVDLRLPGVGRAGIGAGSATRLSLLYRQWVGSKRWC